MSFHGMVRCAIAVLLVSVTATAGLASARDRVERQHDRIQQGKQSGELTAREAARLRAEQARIRADVRRAARDGDVTAQEKLRLDREQDRASRHIFRQKHDRQDRE